jgi:TolB-like protein/Tfp pilus assembly protein PilF
VGPQGVPDIFLSYNREDQAVARLFADAFAAEGFDVWWDVTLRSGEAYDEVTEKALRTAKAVVVLWSSRSVVSRWVRAEATLADRNKTLVPVMIEPCDRPIMFELTQTAELSHWRGETDDAAWRALVADVRRHQERTEPAESPPPAAMASPAKPKAAAGKRGGAPALAVLPFSNRSGLPEDDVFAFGMVEDLIEAASQGLEVRVLASSATARFRHGGLPDLAAMARELGVRYVLEGNVRRTGANLRVSTQLVEAASGDILWTQRFERPLAHLAELQEDLVLEMASHLRVQAHKQDLERALRKPGDLTAWEAVMRAFAASRRLTGPALIQALTEAQKAVDIAPDYGLALALLSQCQAIVYYLLTPDDPDAVAPIRERADKAMRLDPDNSVVFSTVAGALHALGFLEDALAAGQRAIALNPNNEYAYLACGIVCCRLNRPDEAVAYFDKEQELAPNHPASLHSFMWRATAHAHAERWDEALKANEISLALAPDEPAALIGQALFERQFGRDAAARNTLRRARDLDPVTPLAIWELRFGRSYSNSPLRPRLLADLRELWAEIEAAVA